MLGVVTFIIHTTRDPRQSHPFLLPTSRRYWALPASPSSEGGGAELLPHRQPDASAQQVAGWWKMNVFVTTDEVMQL